jgi:hypothetical protein
MMFSSSIHLPANDKISFFFMAGPSVSIPKEKYKANKTKEKSPL